MFQLNNLIIEIKRNCECLLLKGIISCLVTVVIYVPEIHPSNVNDSSSTLKRLVDLGNNKDQVAVLYLIIMLFYHSIT